MNEPEESKFGFMKSLKPAITLLLVGLVLIIGGALTNKSSVLPAKQTQDFPKESIVSNKISVDISGAVNKPGVFELENGSRVDDLIKLAGGVLPEVNQEYFSKNVNLAQKLTDGAKIYIPYQGEVGIVSNENNVAGVSKVNINTANQSELEALPGIGPVTASKVISGRPYQKPEDLLTQKVVSKATFEKIKDQLIVY